jgi:iron complex outermembrane receptor protein
MSNTSVYTALRQELPLNLSLSAGLRYEMNKTYGNEWVPQGGITWNPLEGTNFKASVSKGYRPPSIRELYLFPPANEELLPERMVNYEIGWNQQWLKGKISTEVVAYRSVGENIIVMVPSAPPPPPQFRNTGAFNNTGMEFVFNYNPLQNLSFHTNYAFILMDNPLPATPGHNLFLSGRYSIGKFSFNLKLKNIFDLYNESGGEIVVVEESFQLLGARVEYRATDFLKIYLSGHNLLNQEYQINAGYPMPGATVFGGIALKFSPGKNPEKTE